MGKFITLEGVDGAGKSTQLTWIAEFLSTPGREVIVTREPGGTPVAERLRELLLDHTMQPETEALLMFAARREHLADVIMPALRRGAWVVCDRFTDATYAYQGGGHGVAAEKLAALENFVHKGFAPDFTLLFDLPIEIARERCRDAGGGADTFEKQWDSFFARVRAAYLDRVRIEPERIRLIDASLSIDAIRTQLRALLSELT